MGQQPDSLFYEEQRFQLPFLRLMLAIPPAILTLLAIWQVGLGHPWGKRPMSNASIIGWSIFLWLVYLRLIFVRLVTELRAGELRVSMRGLHRKRQIPLSDIKSAEMVTFDPIRDFRGYGIRTTKRAIAYLAAGNEGVRLQLARGKPVIVGSQRPKDLADAISRAR